jgi:hypothetical protein
MVPNIRIGNVNNILLERALGNEDSILYQWMGNKEWVQ